MRVLGAASITGAIALGLCATLAAFGAPLWTFLAAVAVVLLVMSIGMDDDEERRLAEAPKVTATIDGRPIVAEVEREIARAQAGASCEALVPVSFFWCHTDGCPNYGQARRMTIRSGSILCTLCLRRIRLVAPGEEE